MDWPNLTRLDFMPDNPIIYLLVNQRTVFVTAAGAFGGFGGAATPHATNSDMATAEWWMQQAGRIAGDMLCIAASKARRYGSSSATHKSHGSDVTVAQP